MWAQAFTEFDKVFVHYRYMYDKQNSTIINFGVIRRASTGARITFRS